MLLYIFSIFYFVPFFSFYLDSRGYNNDKLSIYYDKKKKTNFKWQLLQFICLNHCPN